MYAFANQALDLMLARHAAAHPGTLVTSVAHSVWGEVGMGARMGSVGKLARMGIGAIPPDEGVARFMRLCTADPGFRQVVFAARLGGLDTRPQPPLPAGTWRFIDSVVAYQPQVRAASPAAHERSACKAQPSKSWCLSSCHACMTPAPWPQGRHTASLVAAHKAPGASRARFSVHGPHTRHSTRRLQWL